MNRDSAVILRILSTSEIYDQIYSQASRAKNSIKANKKFPEAETKLIFQNKIFPPTHFRWLNFSMKLLKFFLQTYSKIIYSVETKISLRSRFFMDQFVLENLAIL
jgi:hypothetical protein